MEPLLHSVTTTVAQDMRELARAPQLEVPALLEKDPPNWRWHLPLGFVTLAAAGALLIAAAAVQSRIQERRPGARVQRKTKMQKKRLRPRPALPREQQSGSLVGQRSNAARASAQVAAWASTESAIGLA